MSARSSGLGSIAMPVEVQRRRQRTKGMEKIPRLLVVTTRSNASAELAPTACVSVTQLLSEVGMAAKTASPMASSLLSPGTLMAPSPPMSGVSARMATTPYTTAGHSFTALLASPALSISPDTTKIPVVLSFWSPLAAATAPGWGYRAPTIMAVMSPTGRNWACGGRGRWGGARS